MLPRVIPTLLLYHESLVKTIRFGRFEYVGDPCNTVRIFNELEVDELVFLDIGAARERSGPNLKVLRDIANECFMPLAYGGGIKTPAEAATVLKIGFEKIVINTQAVENRGLVTTLADEFGRQAVVGSIDVRNDWRGRPTVRTRGGRHNARMHPLKWLGDSSARVRARSS